MKKNALKKKLAKEVVKLNKIYLKELEKKYPRAKRYAKWIDLGGDLER